MVRGFAVGNLVGMRVYCWEPKASELGCGVGCGTDCSL